MSLKGIIQRDLEGDPRRAENIQSEGTLNNRFRSLSLQQIFLKDCPSSPNELGTRSKDKRGKSYDVSETSKDDDENIHMSDSTSSSVKGDLEKNVKSQNLNSNEGETKDGKKSKITLSAELDKLQVPKKDIEVKNVEFKGLSVSYSTEALDSQAYSNNIKTDEKVQLSTPEPQTKEEGGTEEIIYISENDSICESHSFKRGPEKPEKERKVRNIPAGVTKGDHEDKKRKIKVWTSTEDDLLFKLYQEYGTKWEEVARKIPGRNASQCSQRWRRKFKPEKIRKNWTAEEDRRVLELVEKHGTNWHLIAKALGEMRTGKQVRERYINKLDPRIKNSSWTSEEDQIILFFYINYGPCWSHISRYIGNRPENMVKNRFYSHLKRVHKIEEKPNTLRTELINNSSAPLNQPFVQQNRHLNGEQYAHKIYKENGVFFGPAVPIEETQFLRKVSEKEFMRHEDYNDQSDCDLKKSFSGQSLNDNTSQDGDISDGEQLTSQEQQQSTGTANLKINNATIQSSPMTLKCEDIDNQKVEVGGEPYVYPSYTYQNNFEDQNYINPQIHAQRQSFEMDGSMKGGTIYGMDDPSIKREDSKLDDIKLMTSVGNRLKVGMSNESNASRGIFKIGSTESSKDDYLNNPLFQNLPAEPSPTYLYYSPLNVQGGIFFAHNPSSDVFMEMSKSSTPGGGNIYVITPPIKYYQSYSNENIKNDVAYPTDGSMRMGGWPQNLGGISEVPTGDYSGEGDLDAFHQKTYN